MAVERNPGDRPPVGARGAFPAVTVAAAGLIKLAKHLALLAILAIVGTANGRSSIGQLTILLLVVTAALLHAFGSSLRRIAKRSHLPRRQIL